VVGIGLALVLSGVMEVTRHLRFRAERATDGPTAAAAEAARKP
jgi:hypothetical protein